jgi:hypothetical protein
MHCLHCGREFPDLEDLMTHELLPHTFVRNLFHLPPRPYALDAPHGSRTHGGLLGSGRGRPHGADR